MKMVAEFENLCYHHYSFNFDKDQVPSKISDVRAIFIAGCRRRAENQAQYLAQHLDAKPDGKRYEVEKLTKSSSRFDLFKVGPALVSDHGMGGPSMMIAVHELILMCREAEILNKIILIRFGTCGGIGVEPGDVCITRRALDPLLQDFIDLKICLRTVRRSCNIDQKTADLLERLLKENPNEIQLGQYQVHSGATIASNDFYEEQGRTNGAICDHTLEDKARFLMVAKKQGVINSEMESNYLAAICSKVGISFGIVCVALVNRLKKDKIEVSTEEIELYQRRLFWTNLLVVRHKMSIE